MQKIGSILIENGIITEAQLNEALVMQKNYNVPLDNFNQNENGDSRSDY